MHGWETQSYIFDPRPTYPLRSVVKRFWSPDSPHLRDPRALTLVFAHGTSFHKEMWEPVMEDLDVLLGKQGLGGGGGGMEGTGMGKVKIREMWTVDAPNHGDSLALNREVLEAGYGDLFGWEEYGRSLHLFLAGLGSGVDVDFSGHNLVGIGHSMGAVCLSLALGYYPKINFKALILCEIMILPRDLGAAATQMLVAGAEKRRDVWSSREEAYKLLAARGIWKGWDARVLKAFVDFGICELPTPEYPDKRGVTLKCTRAQEAATYRDPIGSQRVYANFGNIVKQVPVHMIYGEIDDYIPTKAKKHIVEVLSGGVKNLESVARVKAAGHLIVQMNPTGLAERIFDALVIVAQKDGVSLRASL